MACYSGQASAPRRESSEAVVFPRVGWFATRKSACAPAGFPLRPGPVLCFSLGSGCVAPGCPHVHASLIGLPQRSGCNLSTVALLTIGRSLRRAWSTWGSLAGGSCSWCRLFWRFPTFLYRFRLLFTDLSFGFGEVGGYRSCSVVRRIGGSKQRPSEWFDFCLGLETHPFVKILGSRTAGMSGR